MPISNSYPKGIPIEDQDLFVGTKGSNNRTVNYTAQGVADYLNINSKVAIGGQMSFQFTVVPNIPKTIAFEGGLGDGTAFSAITKLVVSAIDLSTANITIFLNYLNNSQVLLSQQNQPNFFGHYKITGYAQIGASAFYELDLEFIGGNGTIGDKQYYDLVSFVLSTEVAVPNLQEVTDIGNTTSNDIISSNINNSTIIGNGTISVLKNNDERALYIVEDQFLLGVDINNGLYLNPQNFAVNSTTASGVSQSIVQPNRFRAQFDNILNGTDKWAQLSATNGLRLKTFESSIGSFVGLKSDLVRTVSRTIQLPDASGTIPLTVNGNSADTTGAITIPVGTGTVTSVTATSPITSSGGITPDISTSMATNKLIGRSTAGVGVMEEITIGTGLTLSGGTLNTSAAGVTSVGLTMPSAFTVANSPITSSGNIAVTGAGLVSQYVRGDGTLANFPASTGGGASVSYYLNGSVSQGTIGGVAYKEMNSVPVIGAGTDFTINANGYIAQFITDAGDPNKLLIPAGNWNFETYFSASSNGGSPRFYIELYKYDGTTFTLIASNSATPEYITGGTSIDLYFTALAVPSTVLLATDRLAVRFYVIHSGRTITMHTENSHLSQIITTFTTGLTALNGLTDQVQFFDVGTGATNFNISSSGDTHTFNLLFNIRRNANNSSNNNINYNGYAVTGSAESSAVWTITRLTIAASGSITTATATNVAWTNRESATYI